VIDPRFPNQFIFKQVMRSGAVGFVVSTPVQPTIITGIAIKQGSWYINPDNAARTEWFWFNPSSLGMQNDASLSWSVCWIRGGWNLYSILMNGLQTRRTLNSHTRFLLNIFFDFSFAFLQNFSRRAWLLLNLQVGTVQTLLWYCLCPST